MSNYNKSSSGHINFQKALNQPDSTGDNVHVSNSKNSNHENPVRGVAGEVDPRLSGLIHTSSSKSLIANVGNVGNAGKSDSRADPDHTHMGPQAINGIANTGSIVSACSPGSDKKLMLARNDSNRSIGSNRSSNSPIITLKSAVESTERPPVKESLPINVAKATASDVPVAASVKSGSAEKKKGNSLLLATATTATTTYTGTNADTREGSNNSNSPVLCTPPLSTRRLNLRFAPTGDAKYDSGYQNALYSIAEAAGQGVTVTTVSSDSDHSEAATLTDTITDANTRTASSSEAASITFPLANIDTVDSDTAASAGTTTRRLTVVEEGSNCKGRHNPKGDGAFGLLRDILVRVERDIQTSAHVGVQLGIAEKTILDASDKSGSKGSSHEDKSDKPDENNNTRGSESACSTLEEARSAMELHQLHGLGRM